ncbi:MAG: hypothetical protein HYY84_01690 [Deltaproteobacteria bacterium]|nr:hypothetical protein [Deltaproteobacteria bacterium]
MVDFYTGLILILATLLVAFGLSVFFARRYSLALASMCATGIMIYVSLPSEYFVVALPVLALVTIGGMLWIRLPLSGRFPVDDLGFLYSLVIILYGAYPLISFLANGLSATERSDYRLARNMLSPGIMAEIGGMHAVYLFAFATGYLITRHGRQAQLPRTVEQGNRIAWVALVLIVVIVGLRAIIESVFGITQVEYGKAPQYFSLPLVVRQVYLNTQLMLLPLKLAALIALFNDYRRNGKLIVLFFAVFILPVLLRFGERHEFVVLCLVTALLFHDRVRKLSVVEFGILGAVLLAVFLVFGELRGGKRDVQVLGGNEFEACFSTVADIFVSRAAGLLPAAPPQVYLADFLAIIPQQILPFEKITGSEWYLSHFAPDLIELGQGYAFGVLSESIIGLGYFEIFFKGLVIGVFFAKIVAWYRRRGSRWWVAAVYFFICATCFRTFRSSTFELIRSIVYGVLPPFVVVGWVIRWTKRAGDETRNRAPDTMTGGH